MDSALEILGDKNLLPRNKAKLAVCVFFSSDYAKLGYPAASFSFIFSSQINLLCHSQTKSKKYVC